MSRRKVPALPVLLLALGALFPAAARAGESLRPQVRHDLTVVVRPETHEIEVHDRLSLPGGLEGLHRGPNDALVFAIHAGLEMAADGPGFDVAPSKGSATEKAPEAGDEGGGDPTLATFDVRPTSGGWPKDAVIPLRWKGAIHHPPVSEAEEYARSFARSPGTIGPEGAVLTRATWWVPYLGEERVSFRMAVDLPAGWDAVSQGKRVERKATDAGTHVVWDCPHPMEEVYLIASRFSLYERPAGTFDAMAYLREPDAALAGKYLEATAQYVEMYRNLIGPYPFEKFALVENFWETGYGMPSFTLLGPQVIRLPFILHSSYPHEILHNWWGNSVYVDWEKGNWCEGLTAYMADHLIREGQGRGAEYRLDTLKKYRAYVRAGSDLPLTEFRSRHSGATEAVGYGKSLMLFHMLRREVGNEAFKAAVRRFYRENLWHAASFADLALAFSAVTQKDWTPFFAAWTEQAGAPEVRATSAIVEGADLVLTLAQTQNGPAMPLRVPVAITMEGRPEALLVQVPLPGRVAKQAVPVPARPIRVDVDPEFDLFRRLDAAEIPPTLGDVFGADRVTIIVPQEGKDPLAAAWRRMAEGWKGGGADVQVVAEDALAEVPSDRAIWILGSANRWSSVVRKRVRDFGSTVTDEQVDFGETRSPRQGLSWALVARHPRNEDLAIGWIGADSAAALPGLARKLPHYGKYSWLGFTGDEPANVAKGQWPTTWSRQVILLPPRDGGTAPPRGTLPARQPLARLAPVFDAERLMAHVRYLADDAREGRGLGSKGLEEATAYVATAFKEIGLQPGGDDGSYFQAFTEPGGPDGKPVALKNVIGVLPGTNPSWPSQAVVLGAHVDHLGRGWPDVRAGNEGKIHNGADDNASGVATLIEVARALASEPRPRTIVFVAFTAEEWALRGSRHYVKATTRWPARDAFAMVNMDTVGRLGANKLSVFGTGSAREWPHVVMGVGYTTGVEATSIPDSPQASDQVAFAEAGVPAIQIFSGANEDYHRPTDDVEKIDAAGLVKVAAFVRETVAYLAERAEPLTKAGAAPTSAPGEGPGRRVLLGTVPEFSFAGPGVKVASVVEGSPAAQAGLQPGDVLLSLGETALPDLKAYSDALKAHAPGDVVPLRWKRGDREMTANVTLAAR